ncbi:hypothetical protein B0H10DRAFT_2188512 [Mycena sp. CBHHK59/15]|nr:hypothetical protein B0H10DRAFT_2188512 [Mycena sp. CBHHK59/15]
MYDLPLMPPIKGCPSPKREGKAWPEHEAPKLKKQGNGAKEGQKCRCRFGGVMGTAFKPFGSPLLNHGNEGMMTKKYIAKNAHTKNIRSGPSISIIGEWVEEHKAGGSGMCTSQSRPRTRSKEREAETASCTSKDKTESLELRYGRQSRPETRDSTADRPEVKTQSIDSSDLSKVELNVVDKGTAHRVAEGGIGRRWE